MGLLSLSGIICVSCHNIYCGCMQLINNVNNGMPQQLQYCSYNRSSSETSPLSSESSMIIEGMSKACRYNPEEKKERIERYRNKRNLRNFNKTIKVTSIIYLFFYLFASILYIFFNLLQNIIDHSNFFD